VWTAHRPARLTRLRPDEIDQVDVHRGPAAMHGWARKALLSAALGKTGNGRYIGVDDTELIRLALILRDLSGIEG
jgi:hypothetical protein